MTHLTPTSPAWPAMWDALAEATGDYADCCPETGEVWQYMGTDGGIHCFRHRHRPERDAAGRVLPPIKGFAGRHVDRVYLHMDAETLRVVKVSVRAYLDDTAADYEQPRKPVPENVPEFRKASFHREPFDCSGGACQRDASGSHC